MNFDEFYKRYLEKASQGDVIATPEEIAKIYIGLLIINEWENKQVEKAKQRKKVE